MSTLHIYSGLPASGKSTKALAECAAHNWKRVNKDLLREMLHGRWSQQLEKDVIAARDVLIAQFLKQGYDVVSDDTNFGKHREELAKIAADCGARPELHYFDVPVQECVRRDGLRPKPVGAKVIYGMYQKYVRPAQVARLPHPELPAAVICDIDGTLADCGHRSPYDVKAAGVDTVVKHIAELLRRYAPTHRIIFMSGRDEGAGRAITEEWLRKHAAVPVTHLYMRPAGDTRPDEVVKRELYFQHVDMAYNVEFVLDDRNKVVDMWRELGLPCLQVAEGAF